MSGRKRAAHRRIQPYAWLGAGAVTLGMGAAMVGGTAVAFASTGTDAADNTSTSASADSASAKTHTRSEAPRQRAARTGRSGSVAGDAASATPVLRERLAAAAQDALPAPAAAVKAAATANDNTAPVAAETPKAAHPRVSRIARDLVGAVVPSQSDAVAAVRNPAPAAVVAGSAADVTPSPDSWLPGAVTPEGTNPGNQIIPGQHVQLAMEEIAVTQGMIKAATWGSGNFIAGIGSLGPQALLATAQLSLTIWGATNAGVQQFLSAVAKIPVVNLVGRTAVVGEMLVPRVSDISLGVASVLLPTLGWVGADVTSAEAVLASARSDGKVYSIVPMRVKVGTEPTVKAKLNGGRKATLLVDTGASGIVTTPDKIGSADLGPEISNGTSCFSGGVCYSYKTYNMTVDLGDGATTTAPVNIVTDTPEYPTSVADFKDFFAWGADGIIGIGANTAGPGPAPIPNSVMPGELSDGALVFQGLIPLGLGGVMVLGPNPLPTKASVPGASDAYVQVSINGGPKQDGGAIIDSGGVFGTLNDYFMPGQTGDYVPAGTKIDVYTADGSTLLYSYTTKSASTGRGTEFIGSGLFNTGNAPFAKGPIYINYGFDQPYGQGSTDFSIW